MTGREYPSRPLVGIGIIVLRPDAVLLVRRGRAPALGAWSLPGGAQELGETAEEAARRELLEETGLKVGPLTLVANVDSIHRDASERVQWHYTILDFAAAWVSGEPKAGADATCAVFAPLAELQDYSLWTEAHRVIGLAKQALSFVDAACPAAAANSASAPRLRTQSRSRRAAATPAGPATA